MENITIELFNLQIGNFEYDSLIGVGDETEIEFEFELSILSFYIHSHEISKQKKRSLFRLHFNNGKFNFNILFLKNELDYLK